MDSGIRRERVRRISLALMAVTAPAPAAGVALGGLGWPWALAPVAAGVVTVSTMRAKRVPVPLSAPVVYPERVIRVDVYATSTNEPGVQRELIAGEVPR